jgi:hypothetical protein
MGERRRLQRFDLITPARVVVESESGERLQLDLTTKDVSSAGAYLYCSQQVFEGARVRTELIICPGKPPGSAGDNGRAKVRVRGTVIRVDSDGIAVRFESKYKITALGSRDSVAGTV